MPPELGIRFRAVPPELGIGFRAVPPELGIGFRAVTQGLGIGFRAVPPELGDLTGLTTAGAGKCWGYKPAAQYLSAVDVV